MELPPRQDDNDLTGITNNNGIKDPNHLRFRITAKQDTLAAF